jgi:predicted enzyme involved in methoxymalonyl-ACP biosynthesis
VWNIGSDAVVFVDDNELELELMKAAFPEIECMLFRKDDPTFLVELRDRFAKREVREEDTLRARSLRESDEIREAHHQRRHARQLARRRGRKDPLSSAQTTAEPSRT